MGNTVYRKDGSNNIRIRNLRHKTSVYYHPVFSNGQDILIVRIYLLPIHINLLYLHMAMYICVCMMINFIIIRVKFIQQAFILFAYIML